MLSKFWPCLQLCYTKKTLELTSSKYIEMRFISLVFLLSIRYCSYIRSSREHSSSISFLWACRSSACSMSCWVSATISGTVHTAKRRNNEKQGVLVISLNFYIRLFKHHEYLTVLTQYIIVVLPEKIFLRFSTAEASWLCWTTASLTSFRFSMVLMLCRQSLLTSASELWMSLTSSRALCSWVNPVRTPSSWDWMAACETSGEIHFMDNDWSLY